MLILVSQDKKCLVPFNNAFNFKIVNFFNREETKNEFLIVCYDTVHNQEILGRYDTEEKAMKVLEEIKLYYNGVSKEIVYSQGDPSFTFSDSLYFHLP